MKLDEITEPRIPPAVGKAFAEIADQQRGAPEQVMLKIQNTYGGGVLNVMVEHIGDLTHRMTEHAERGYWLEDIIKEKVRRGIYYLAHPYGFDKEMGENMRANNTDAEKLDALLLQYANEHENLPVYNAAQYHGREAAIALGYKNWDKSLEHLQVLQNMLDKGAYNRVAASYQLSDADGQLKTYSP